MTTTRNGVGRNRGFEFTLQIEEQGKGCKLCILSPLGHLITVALNPSQLKAIVFLLAVFKRDVVNPNVASAHKGRRKVATISRAIHKTENYVSKNAGRLKDAIIETAWRNEKFAPEASLLPEFFDIIEKGPDRGHRLNVDVAIEYLGTPPGGPNASATTADRSPPSLDNGQAPAASSNGCEPQPPEGEIAPSKSDGDGEIPPPLVRPAQIDEKSWTNGQSARKKDRNRPDNSGHTPA